MRTIILRLFVIVGYIISPVLYLAEVFGSWLMDIPNPTIQEMNEILNELWTGKTGI